MSYNLKHLATLYIIIGLLIFSLFLQRSCNNNKQPFEKVKTVIKYDTIFKPSEIQSKVVTKYKTIKGKDVYIPGKVDTVEVKVFEKATDSVQFNMFTNATKIRSYKNDFSDNNADVSIYTETKGELLKIVPTVHIKQVKKVETKFALYVGGGISNNLQFNNFAVEAKLGLQNKKGDILSVSYDTQQNIGVGYSFRLINIKK
jgi:hypothetical protein